MFEPVSACQAFMADWVRLNAWAQLRGLCYFSAVHSVLCKQLWREDLQPLIAFLVLAERGLHRQQNQEQQMS